MEEWMILSNSAGGDLILWKGANRQALKIAAFSC